MKYLILLLFLLTTSCGFDIKITQDTAPTEKPKPTTVYRFYYGDRYMESCKKVSASYYAMVNLSYCTNYPDRTYYNVTNYWVETK